MRIIRNSVGLIWIMLLVACATPSRPNLPSLPEPAPVAAAAPKPPRIGLALGGGAARGFAHVGVIQALEAHGIRPDFVVGTSAGSLVAALYASGRSGPELQRLAETMEEAEITDWSLPIFSRGVLRGEALARYVNQQVGSKPIEALTLPLGIVATDLASGQGILFQRGDTGTAVRASSAVPAVFQPVRIAGREYVDGGLVAPVPVGYTRRMGAELIVAVDISSAPEANAASDTMQILLQTFAIMGKSINQFELASADVVIRPALASMKGADFGARKNAIEAGRQAMLMQMPRLKQLITEKTR